MIRLKLLLGLAVLGGILACGWLQNWTSTEVMVVLIISLAQILEGVSDTLFSLYRLAGRQVQEAGASAMAQFLGVLYGAAALLFGLGIAAVSCFLLVANALRLFLAAAIGAKIGLMPSIGLKGARAPTLRFGNLSIIAGISFLGSFYNQVQVFLMKYFRDLSDVAVYGVARGVAGGLADLVSTFIVGAVLYPKMAQAAANGTESLGPSIRAYFWRLAGVGLGIAFFLATLGGDVLTFLYGPRYAESVTPLQILGLAMLLSFGNNLLIHVFLAQHRERLLLAFHLAPVGVSLILGPLLIPWLGASGAALNLLACRGTMSLLIFVAAQKHYHIFGWPQVAPFLQGGLILGGVYWGLGLIGLPAPHLPVMFALLAYAWWLWRRASQVDFKDPDDRVGYEVV
jgi:O-antigen/teichoic acid export membrane protein